MAEIEVPQYFICPISLQIMKDPVTTASGITYDRESIEHWLSTTKDTTASCPLTNQPLPRDSDLTPNLTLRRLIQAWCVANSNNGVDRIPTPKSPLTKPQVLKLIRDLAVPDLRTKALEKMEELAGENEKNRACMVEAGAVKAMVLYITRCFNERRTGGLAAALKTLRLIWKPTTAEEKMLVEENYDLVLKTTLEVASSNLLGRLKLDFFTRIVKLLRVDRISQQATKSAMHVLIEACPWGRNRTKIVEAGAVFELIELELERPEKQVTELVFCLLAHLCATADGRAQLLKHAGGLAMVAKRILRVSPATDDRAVHILMLVSQFSATNEVLREMLRVGGVSKLCMVLQADCEKYLKKKAREVLRLHSKVWKDSPCIAIYLLTKDPR